MVEILHGAAPLEQGSCPTSERYFSFASGTYLNMPERFAHQVAGHRRRCAETRDTFALDQLGGVLGVPLRHQHEPTLCSPAREEAAVEAHHVKERNAEEGSGRMLRWCGGRTHCGHLDGIEFAERLQKFSGYRPVLIFISLNRDPLISKI